MVEYVIGPTTYLLLGLTAVFVFFMPIILTLSFGLLVGIEHLRSRRRRAREERTEPPFAIQRFDVYDLIPKLIPGYLLTGVVVILGLITLGAWVFLVAELLLAVSTVHCARWWLRLRRDGVLHAEVYVLTAWLVTRLAWLLWFILDSGGETTQHFYRPFGGDLPWSYLSASLLEDTWMSVGAFLLAIMAIVTTWILTRFERPLLHPALLLALAVPAIGLFWVATPSGFVHLAFTVPVVGYAISREVRRLEDATEATHKLASGKKSLATAIAGVSVAAALGVYSAITVATPGGTTLVPRAIEYILPQVVAVGLFALLLLVVAVALGVAHRFGAMLLGLVWLLVMAFTFDAPSLESWSPIFGYREYIATTIGVVAVLTLMWRAFGPGAFETNAGPNIRTDPHQPPL